jgi:putative ABC transport system permease protein
VIYLWHPATASAYLAKWPRNSGGYFLAESTLLSIAGSVIGIGLSFGAVRLLVAFAPVTLPRLEEVRLDAPVLAFTLALSLLTALAFAAIPWLHLAPLSASLHESSRSNTASVAAIGLVNF